MPCYHPLTGYRSRDLNPSGKRSIVFNPGPTTAFTGVALKLPCGQCIGCKLERSRQWAIRCVHEASLYDANAFLTLTYDEDRLPENGSLIVSDHQKFMKRLRKLIAPKRLRFFHCGEYGSKYGRPHYHTLLFGHDFTDKVLLRETARGDEVFTSPTLEKLWPHGFSTIGDVTFESAAYVARYITKKMTGTDPVRGNAYYEGRKPEYVTMSRRPGIAQAWLDKYKSDVFPSDEIVLRGKRLKPPKFYLNQLSGDELERLKSARHENAVKRARENSHLRLLTREEVHELKADQLIRSYEHEA